MFDLDPTALIASGAIVIFLTQQAKRWVMPDFLPLVALAFGIIIQLVNDLALTAALDHLVEYQGAIGEQRPAGGGDRFDRFQHGGIGALDRRDILDYLEAIQQGRSA